MANKRLCNRTPRPGYDMEIMKWLDCQRSWKYLSLLCIQKWQACSASKFSSEIQAETVHLNETLRSLTVVASASATNHLSHSTDTHKLNAAYFSALNWTQRTDAFSPPPPLSHPLLFFLTSRQIQGAGHLKQCLAASAELQSAGATSGNLPQRHRHTARLRVEFHSQTSANGQGGRSWIWQSGLLQAGRHPYQVGGGQVSENCIH